MRRTDPQKVSLHLGTRALGMLALIATVAASGCAAIIGADWESYEPANCERTETCTTHPAGGGGGGGTPAGCVPSENADPVGDACGVFVSSSLGDDAASGTPGAPVKTVAEAIARATTNGTRAYACAEAFDEAIEVPAGMTIFGGLDCANGWRWIGETTKTTIAGPADAIAVKLLGGEGATRIEDVAVRAADAVLEGGSSIAVLADGAIAELARCELAAGKGADGAKGAPGEQPAMPGDPVPPAEGGTMGNNGTDACSDVDGTPGPDASLLGGAQGVKDCGGEQSIGGSGGIANIANGGAGEVQPTATAETALGGIGEPSAGTWDCAGAEPNGRGDDGQSGTAGDPGPGATGLGTLTSSSYMGVPGGAGTAGKPGQGGGGGGGAKGGNAICSGGVAGAGASGGSGGSGGCGGKPGQGGAPGGASIALASVNATVTLTDCTLTAANGGNGGAGGDLQPGGPGGNPGTGGQGVGGSKAACDGGKGGQGGNGGPGGGGLGGPSLPIAFTGTPVTKAGTTTLLPGTAGSGGPGGNSDQQMNGGAAGIAAEEQELP